VPARRRSPCSTRTSVAPSSMATSKSWLMPSTVRPACGGDAGGEVILPQLPEATEIRAACSGLGPGRQQHQATTGRARPGGGLEEAGTSGRHGAELGRLACQVDWTSASTGRPTSPAARSSRARRSGLSRRESGRTPGGLLACSTGDGRRGCQRRSRSASASRFSRASCTSVLAEVDLTGRRAPRARGRAKGLGYGDRRMLRRDGRSGRRGPARCAKRTHGRRLRRCGDAGPGRSTHSLSATR